MRHTHKSLREQLTGVAAMAREQGLPIYVADGTIGRAGAVDIENTFYGYSVSMTTRDGCSGVRIISQDGLTAAECAQFLRGMGTALDLRRSLEHCGIIGFIRHESAESRELALYVENARHLWPRIAKRLSKQWQDGTFSLDSAVSYIERNGCQPAAKEYVGEHCGMNDSHLTVFPKTAKTAAAESLARGLVAEFKLGNLWE